MATDCCALHESLKHRIDAAIAEWAKENDMWVHRPTKDGHQHRSYWSCRDQVGVQVSVALKDYMYTART